DLYALGAMLYEMIAGRRPFNVPADAALSTSILHEEAPPLRAEVPQPLVAVVKQLMQKSATDRPADALAVSRALESWVASTRVPPSAVADWLAKVLPAEELATPAAVIPATAHLVGEAATELSRETHPPRRVWPAAAAVAAALAVVAGIAAWRLATSDPEPVAVVSEAPVEPAAPTP